MRPICSDQDSIVAAGVVFITGWCGNSTRIDGSSLGPRARLDWQLSLYKTKREGGGFIPLGYAASTLGAEDPTQLRLAVPA